ncbi:hypothetical protein ACK8QS_22820 (plasmid) [Ectopseudomonas mendocina]
MPTNVTCPSLFRASALAAALAAALLTGCASNPYPLTEIPGPESLFSTGQDNSVPEMIAVPAEPVKPVKAAKSGRASKNAKREPVAPEVQAQQLYTDGMTVQVTGDYEMMLDKLMKSAELGNASASYEMARMLSEGVLLEKDVNMAKVYLEHSAEHGNAEALRVLGWNYLLGEYGRVEMELGTDLMRTAARNSVRAQRELGMLYANIYRPHLSDLGEAEHYLSLASYGKDAEATYQLGRLKQSRGDIPGARVQFEKARELDHPKAMALVAAGQEEVSKMQGRAYYRQGMDILVKSRKSSREEARAYALVSLADDLGYYAAGKELQYLGGIKDEQDKKNPGWLDAEKASIQNEIVVQ